MIFQSQLLSGLDKVLLYLERRGQAPLPSLEIYLAIVRCDTDRFQRFSNPTRQVAVLDDKVRYGVICRGFTGKGYKKYLLKLNWATI